MDCQRVLVDDSLGICYLDGIGVQKNEVIALSFFEAAAKKNHPAACFNVAVMKWNGSLGMLKLALLHLLLVFVPLLLQPS